MEQLKYNKRLFKDYKRTDYVYVYNNEGEYSVLKEEIDTLDSFNPETDTCITLEDYGYVSDLIQILESE